jgi:hypothetical protein
VADDWTSRELPRSSPYSRYFTFEARYHSAHLGAATQIPTVNFCTRLARRNCRAFVLISRAQVLFVETY